jgi:hypothetical protein
MSPCFRQILSTPLPAIDVILLYDDKDHMGYAVLGRNPEHW